MKKRSKRYNEVSKLIDKKAQYSFAEGIELVKKASTPKFDESFEIYMKLG